MAINVSQEANTIPDTTSAASARRVNEAIVDALEDIAQAIDTLTAKMDADFADVTNASVDYATSVGAIETALDAVIERL